MSYQGAVEIRAQLRLDIEELLAQAETADAEDQDSQKLPEEIARREKLASKMERAIEELEARARKRQQKADAFDRLEQEGVEIYCSVHREDAHNERHYDFRPETQSGRAVKEPADERLVVMRDKLRSEEGKALYGRRNHTVDGLEFVANLPGA
jgi:hypothetical protein